jgi:hypothetical protein
VPKPRVLEKDFQRWVTDVAERYEWLYWHVPAPMQATKKGTFVGSKKGAGLPDLILMHDDPPRLIFAEVKGTTGWGLTKGQKRFMEAVGKIAGPTLAGYVWSPGDEDSIEAILRTRSLV